MLCRRSPKSVIDSPLPSPERREPEPERKKSKKKKNQQKEVAVDRWDRVYVELSMPSKQVRDKAFNKVDQKAGGQISFAEVSKACRIMFPNYNNQKARRPHDAAALHSPAQPSPGPPLPPARALTTAALARNVTRSTGLTWPHGAAMASLLRPPHAQADVLVRHG